MAGNTPTFVLVMWYNIDVIRCMPQRFLCAVNYIHSKETFSQNETAILRPSANRLGDQNWNQTSSKWISLIRTLKTEHSGLQVRWPIEGANMRRRDDGEGRSDPRSAWTCRAKQARDDLHGSKGYFLTASRWLGRSPCNARQPRSATAKRGYDVIPQITACNTPGSRRENQPGSRDEIRQKEALMTEKKFKIRCMKVQIEWNSITGRYIYDDEQSGKNFLEHVLCKRFKTRKADQPGWICGNNTK